MENDRAVGRVGKPGFFSSLGDSVDFCWTCFFAIEGLDLPLQSLLKVRRLDRQSFGAFEALPPDVVVAARDIDSSYQEYGFRDDWMFKSVLGDLKRRGLPADEVTAWPQVGAGKSVATR